MIATIVLAPHGFGLVSGRGVFGASVLVELPVRGNTVLGCPDLATVLVGPTPSANRLAVGFYYWPPNDAGYVQAFSLVGGTARYRGELPGSVAQLEPTSIGSQDFDGDGRGDLWEQTDKGDGFDAFLSVGSTFRPLASLQGATVSVQFADLNRRRGTDLLLSNVRPFRSEPSAVVVDGLTGAVQRLAFGAALPDGAYVDTYQLSIVDLDHNGYPDLRVDAVGNAESGTVVGTSKSSTGPPPAVGTSRHWHRPGADRHCARAAATTEARHGRPPRGPALSALDPTAPIDRETPRSLHDAAKRDRPWRVDTHGRERPQVSRSFPARDRGCR